MWKEREFEARLQGAEFGKDETKEKLEEVKRRAEVRLKGEREVVKQELDEIGFGYEFVEGDE
jgi:hypothetical protein